MFVIGLVNYKSSIYMEVQLKIYRDFAGEDFQIIIVENSQNQEEANKLLEIVQNFSLPIRILPGITTKYSSAAHGEGLQQIYELILKEYFDAEYFIAQDPDFFWVMPNFLSVLRKNLASHDVVGPPYHYPSMGIIPDGWIGSPDFPAAFGAAHKMEVLKQIKADFRPLLGGKTEKDVGWQIREKLMGKPYLAFRQEVFDSGDIGPKPMSRRYNLESSIIAYHLHHGSFETTISRGMSLARSSRGHRQKLRDMMAPEKWQKNRQKMCEFMWKEINDAAKKQG